LRSSLREYFPAALDTFSEPRSTDSASVIGW
jgi:hypothetical protein